MLIINKHLSPVYAVLVLVLGLLMGCDQSHGDKDINKNGNIAGNIVTVNKDEYREAIKQGLMIPIQDLPLLQQAIINGDEKSVLFAIKKGENLDVSDSYGQTPLFYAIDYKNMSILKLLLNNGTNVSAKTLHDETPLMRAASEHNTEAVKLLLDKGADPNAINASYTAALHYAAFYKADMVELLLDAGADINAKNKDGTTALMIAARHGKKGIVKILIKNGADKSVKDNKQRNALQHAKETNQIDIIKILNTKQ